MWTAELRSIGSSSEPPLMLMELARSLSPCQIRDPQSGQKKQSSARPLSASLDHCFGVPRTSRNPDLLTITEMPNAEADCLRHSVQWQT